MATPSFIRILIQRVSEVSPSVLWQSGCWEDNLLLLLCHSLHFILRPSPTVLLFSVALLSGFQGERNLIIPALLWDGGQRNSSERCQKAELHLTRGADGQVQTSSGNHAATLNTPCRYTLFNTRQRLPPAGASCWSPALKRCACGNNGFF